MGLGSPSVTKFRPERLPSVGERDGTSIVHTGTGARSPLTKMSVCLGPWGKDMYTIVLRVEVFVSPYTLETRPYVSVQCLTFEFCLGTSSLDNPWPLEPSMFVSLSSILAAYSLHLLVELVGSNEKRVYIVTVGVTPIEAPCCLPFPPENP